MVFKIESHPWKLFTAVHRKHTSRIIMATAQKKGKNDKKSAKKYEDTMSVGDKTDDVPNQEELQMTPAPENGTPITESPPQAPSPDPVYEEPVLTQLIVQRCDLTQLVLVVGVKSLYWFSRVECSIPVRGQTGPSSENVHSNP